MNAQAEQMKEVVGDLIAIVSDSGKNDQTAQYE